MAQTITNIGKYKVERELGRGAMGVVYEGFDPVVERRVAIKTIRLDVEDSQDLLNRLKREARSVGQLEHTNVVTLYEAGESNGLFYLAMQFIEGETLQDRLQRQRWFTLKETMEIFAQICSGLDYAHSHGVVHRDIKPANIMITRTGVVKLTDFGIAKQAGGGTSTSGLIVGTPSYMSPEQAVGKPLDGRSDIFSLGSILYELLTGEKAFPGQNVTTVMYKIVHESPTPVIALQPGLDSAVEPIVLKALAKNPNSRFQTCQELALALQNYVSHAMAAASHNSATFRSPQSSGTSAAPKPLTVASVSAPAVMPPPHIDPTTAAAAPRPSNLNIAWLAIGALGSLLVVVAVLLLLQMRKPPGAGPLGQSTSPAGTVTTPANPPQGTDSKQNSSGKPGDQTSSRVASGQNQAKQKTPDSTSHSKKEKPTKPAASNPIIRQRPAGQSQPAVQPPESQQPETFGSLLLKGDVAFQQSHYEDALAYYKKAYLLDSGNSEVKRKIKVVLTMLGRPEEATRYQ